MRLARINYDTVSFKGGLDQKTPILSLPSGYARSSLNFEAAELGGYRRIAGYERFDGRFEPHLAAYDLLGIEIFITTPAVGMTISGATTGATALVAAIGIDYIVFTNTIGTFSTNEIINVDVAIVGRSTANTITITAKEKALYKARAADVFRNNITAVPGSGACIGGFLYNDIVYALRANVANTAVDMYKQSITGWINVPFFNEVSFTAGGAVVPIEGATLTQGVTISTIKRVVLESGSWGNNTAAGRLIITTPVGNLPIGSYAQGASSSGATTMTLGGLQTTITMNVGGKLESKEGNFAAGALTRRIYAVDGVNRAFEFDGEVLVPLNTGTTIDTPKHIEIMIGYLFLTFDSMVLSSSPGLPYNYTALSGAGNVSVDNIITNIKAMRGAQANATLLITSRTSFHLMYGTSWSNFNAIPMESGGGAIENTVQLMDDAYLFDSRGITTLQAVQAFGNFQSATLTQNINTFIKSKMNRVSGSSLHRLKGQYRLYFNDGTCLFLTVVNRQVVGAMPIALAHSVYATFSGALVSGDELTFICTTDGFVMKMDVGSSFDGDIIPAHVTLNYNPSKNHRLLKRYRKCALEMYVTSYVDIQFSYSLGYGINTISPDMELNYIHEIQTTKWDTFIWDHFRWDGSDSTPLELEMRGTGENVALTFRSGTNYINEYTLNTATIHYSNRRAKR